MARRHPPAWYPDPRSPARLRRWNGHAWTADVRPFPDWLRTLRLSPGPAHQPTNLAARRLWVASVVSVVTAFAALQLLGGGAAAPARLSDHRFLVAASGACARANATEIAPHLAELHGDAEVARLDKLATAQDALVDELRSLEVASRDQAAVDEWLNKWDAWTTAGHRYAQAAAIGDQARMRTISEHSRSSKIAIDQFAYANGISDCVLFRR
jgi:hypothetical protein